MKKEIDTNMLTLELTKQSKPATANMKIEWETDRNKMDFSKLRWFPEHLLNKPFKIEYSPINLLNKRYPDLFVNRDIEMNNLIDFVNTGVKIIPPSFIRMPKILLSRQNENNMITEKFTKIGLQIHDGCHRISLAKALGITEIPILIFDYEDEFKHSINRWVVVEGYEWERYWI
jgi:hypothetical protein